MSEYWNELARHTDLDEIWMSHPLVRARINERISGEAGVWPVAWLARELASELPLRRTLSVGCGIGNLERDLVSRGVVSSITGIDVSPACIADASVRAAQAGLSERISYECCDARARLAASRDLDAVFFHGSLHHFERHDALLQLVRAALRPGGLLCIDEYAGPSRDEWTAADLMLPNLVYCSLARSIRRARIVRAPVNREDPTEAVESSRIVPAIERAFKVTARRDYGGNLLSIIYPNLHRPPAGTPERDALDAAVRRMLAVEDWMLERGSILGVSSFFVVMVARRES